MSVTGQRMVGIPVVLLHEGEGLILTVETRNGWVYRGYCDQAEDNFNMRMKNVTLTDENGVQSHLNAVYLRGSQIRYIVFPDILRNSPMFKRIEMRKKGIEFAGGLGRGRQQAIAAKVRRQAEEAARGPVPGATTRDAGRGRGRGRGFAGAPRQFGAGPYAQGQTFGAGPYVDRGGTRPSYGGSNNNGTSSHTAAPAGSSSYSQDRGHAQGPSQSHSGGSSSAGRGRSMTLPHWATK